MSQAFLLLFSNIPHQFDLSSIPTLGVLHTRTHTLILSTTQFSTNLHPNSDSVMNTHISSDTCSAFLHTNTHNFTQTHSSTHTFSHLRNTDTHPHTFLHICTSSVDPNMLLRQATLQSLLPYPPLYPKGVYPSTVRTLYTQG